MKKQRFNYIALLLIVPLVYFGCTKDDDPLQFSFTVSITPVNSGTVVPALGIYDDGEQISISAIPAEEYNFLKWSGDATGDANPLVMTISSNTKIIAEFALVDTDGDGIGDNLDKCPNTPEGEIVDATGCASSEVDSDGDGVTDDLDLCPDTPANTEVDEDGCSDFQKDKDGDGVPDDLDLCPDTTANAEVDEDGCADFQKDTDGDGVPDDQDICTDTPPNAEVNEDGCADFQRDTDGDGLTDDLDRCPESQPGSATDAFGCPMGSTYTYIPDDDFEQILIDQGYDNVLDDYVLTSAISAITELSLPSIEHLFIDYSINDFTGLEAFSALESLLIIGADFTGEAIDLSQNSNLIDLTVICSFVENLDLSQTNIKNLSISGNFFFAPCENRMSGLDLSGLTTLKTLSIFNAEFDDLNATLNSAQSLEQVHITSPQNVGGPIDYLDLSANNNLNTVQISAMLTIGPSIINIKNGANQQLVELSLAISPLSIDPDAWNWEPCIEADDPVYIESIITSSDTAPQYSVTIDCGN